MRRVDTAFPLEPELTRTGGVQIVLDDEPHAARKRLRPRPNKQMMVCMLHHSLCNQRRRANALQRSHATRPFLRAVHAAGIQLDDAVSVRQAPETDARIFRIAFDDIDACNHGIERVGSADEQPKGLLDAGSIATVLELVPVP